MRLEAHNKSLSPLFETVACRLFNQLIDPQDVGEALREKVAVEGESLEELLREWTTSLLDLLKVQHMVFSQFHVTELKMAGKGPYALRAEAVGELLDTHRHPLRQDPAGLAIREAQLSKDAAGYHAEVVLSG